MNSSIASLKSRSEGGLNLFPNDLHTVGILKSAELRSRQVTFLIAQISPSLMLYKALVIPSRLPQGL